MKNIGVQLFLFAMISGNMFAQKTIPLEKVCEPVEDESELIEPVDEFKDSLTISLNIFKAFDHDKVYNKEVTFKEVFKDETSIIQIAPKIAIEISIARVIIKGEKFYLRTLVFYTKVGKCWQLLRTSSWEKMNPGDATSYVMQNGVGFDGELIIE